MIMKRLALVLASLAVAVLTLAVPAPAAANDCGGDYLTCLNRTDAMEGSDPLHEEECYAEYWRCMSLLLIQY